MIILGNMENQKSFGNLPKEHSYLAIDLKSFYASVECVERSLNPFDAFLVVADPERTDGTICLAASPALKKLGFPGRARLFEVKARIRELNAARKALLTHGFSRKTTSLSEYESDLTLELDFIIATPRMQLYIDYSSYIYSIYLQHVSSEDIFVYSIDEVFLDVTSYLHGATPESFATEIVHDVFDHTGITVTVGIGPNLYLAKVAMDIVAKHAEPDENNARIAHLTEISYREKLWNHTPLTDFWRIGPGTVKRLHSIGLHTLGDIARCSLGGPDETWNEELLFKTFGKNAEFLIDHAWGIEPVTIADVKSYAPASTSMSFGQVLKCPTDPTSTCLILLEMADSLSLDLLEHRSLTSQLVLHIVFSDHTYWHTTINLPITTNSSRLITEALKNTLDAYPEGKLAKYLNLTATSVISEKTQAPEILKPSQFDLFTDYDKITEQAERDHYLDEAILDIKNRYGKNSILRAISYEEGTTLRERNNQIGGHRR